MKSEESPSRRKALQKLVVLPIGVAAAVAGVGSFVRLFGKPTFTINVIFVQMSEIIEQKSETLQIQSPAKLSDLENVLWKEHPGLQSEPSIKVLINGIGISGDPDLANEDEVTLIKLQVGG